MPLGQSHKSHFAIDLPRKRDDLIFSLEHKTGDSTMSEQNEQNDIASLRIEVLEHRLTNKLRDSVEKALLFRYGTDY